MNRLSVAERAFELAQSGECHSMKDLKLRLSKEGYHAVEQHLQGSSISRPLKEAIKRAAAKLADSAETADG